MVHVGSQKMKSFRFVSLSLSFNPNGSRKVTDRPTDRCALSEEKIKTLKDIFTDSYSGDAVNYADAIGAREGGHAGGDGDVYAFFFRGLLGFGRLVSI